MQVSTVHPDVSGHAVGEVATGCAACPHSWDLHDRIAARFCTATVAGTFTRGCVCTNYPEPAEHTKPGKGSR
jgi:hypothetical protein